MYSLFVYSESKMNHETEHILRQTEWLDKLKSDYDCSFVELEHRFPANFTKQYIKADVYGEAPENKVYIVECGSIDFKKMLGLKRVVEKNFSERNIMTFVFLVNPKSRSGRRTLAGREKIEFEKFSKYPFVKVFP